MNKIKKTKKIKNNKFNSEINNYFNNQKDQISKKINIDDDFEFAFTENDNINIIEIYLNNKLKLRAEYNIIGMYNIPLSVWYWSWNIAFLNKKLIQNTIKIKDYINVLNNEYDTFDKLEAEELYYILKNDNFYVSGNNLDKIIKLALYLTKGIWYFPIKHSMQTNHNRIDFDQMDKIEYILITKILQFI